MCTQGDIGFFYATIFGKISTPLFDAKFKCVQYAYGVVGSRTKMMIEQKRDVAFEAVQNNPLQAKK